jgi:hypothetical protein
MAVLGVRTVSYNGGDAGTGIATGLLEPADTPVVEYIELGWIPSRIELVNYTGALTATTQIITWTKGLAAANAISIAGASGIVTKGVIGPYPFAGGAVTQDAVVGAIVKAGFYVPLALQTDGDLFSWTAFR